MAKYGYLRVSAAHQHSENQIPALEAAGVQAEHMHVDHAVSGTVKGADRPGWRSLLEKVQAGDEVVVYSVSRVGRSMRETQAMVHELRDRGVTFRSVSESLVLVPTATAGVVRVMGDMFLALLAGFAEMERAQMLERQAAGIASARARGARLGRKPALTTEQRDHARQLAAEGRSHREVARLLKVGKGTVQRALAS